MRPHSILSKILDVIVPRQCELCGCRLAGEEEMLCLSCLYDLPLTHHFADLYENGMAQRFWHFIPVERAAALMVYRGQAMHSQLIYQLKYGGRKDIGLYLGRLLGREAQNAGFFDNADALIPIPITKGRQRERGYNQSLCIARGLHEVSRLPILTDAVERILFNGSQTEKHHWERIKNVEGAFSVTADYLPGGSKNQLLQGKHIIIVDDVCTTGATVIACAQALQKAGVKAFSVLTLGCTDS